MTIDTASYFLIDVEGQPGRSRVGGNAPAIMRERTGYLETHRYLLTISGEDFDFLGGNDLSVFLKNDFVPYGDETSYPNVGIDCVIHSPSAASVDSLGRLKIIGEGRLMRMSDPQTHDGYFLKVGGTPELVQNEPSYERALLEDGYSFVFQVDENGFPDVFLNGNYPFGYGALYVYGKFRDGRLSEVVPGFTQF